MTGALHCKSLSDDIDFHMDPPPAAMTDILRVHEWSYVRHIQYKCEELSEDPDAEDGIGHWDSDTAICHDTYQAALYAAGASCHAIDKVLLGGYKNAFCAVRPPGHHAGPRGTVKTEKGGDSNGFCIFNNASISASYAMTKYRETIKRVAIVDFDVHHGNGTEETVRWLRPGTDVTPILCDHSFGKVEVPRFKPWFSDNDTDNVLFVSVHGYGPKDAEVAASLAAEIESRRQAADGEAAGGGVDTLSALNVPRFYPGTGATVLPVGLPKRVLGKHVDHWNAIYLT